VEWCELILYGVGVGPGDPDLVTIGAFRILEEADVMFVPVSSKDRRSVAGEIFARLGDRPAYPFVFPMTNDGARRDEEILRQIEDYREVWSGARSVALPVIGDAAIYATAAHLYSVWKGVCPDLKLKIIPGISAHSLASCVAGEFLALGAERLAVLPGSGDFSGLAESMRASDCVALYKPSALGGELPRLVEATGPWSGAVRVHRAGMAEESVISGEDASSPTDDYLSILLLWRNR
jgi:precorrin-2/cobalt-factor-2 C20-methyltransferase